MQPLTPEKPSSTQQEQPRVLERLSQLSVLQPAPVLAWPEPQAQQQPHTIPSRLGVHDTQRSCSWTSHKCHHCIDR
jgi:hypothetical protein